MCKDELRVTAELEDHPLVPVARGYVSYGLFEDEEKQPRSCQAAFRRGFKLLADSIQQEVFKAACRKKTRSADASYRAEPLLATHTDHPKEHSRMPMPIPMGIAAEISPGYDMATMLSKKEKRAAEEAPKTPSRKATRKKVSFARLGGATIIEVEEHKEVPQFGSGCTANKVISCDLCSLRFLRSGGNIFRVDKSTWLCCHCSFKVAVEEAEFDDVAIGLVSKDEQKLADDVALSTLLGDGVVLPEVAAKAGA
mmetsp:Transcript_85441/g.151065  ORF Transcript_85441/g.151065 Transcript_85441/m.151065 type:complete len:253 (+) Transcript_85441:332-1090(+)|eukprot:CAMPEP_0197640428 /NCGR_PEP_ID=MMETSP1338-20131121/14721_1 /TAXON_ID=43686 ORGANISM="Pelagodinium beii, Strain RCC1491" /NCGR_SAMPLE_ID=MMETSP1338 /ASSEMBLY_ACC=CAM_ASM_000754 /LENGTH=252 /DNA_ID=CAMNT_0043213277 /DNA_START=236 /DNA_END=994 /DNA_ORIENTATION=-